MEGERGEKNKDWIEGRSREEKTRIEMLWKAGENATTPEGVADGRQEDKEAAAGREKGMDRRIRKEWMGGRSKI